MKNIALVFAVSVLFWGCVKQANNTCTNTPPAAEHDLLVSFCAMNSINYTEDVNGILYEIIDPGSGSTPANDSLITVTYVAKYLTGATLVDKTLYPETDYLKNFLEGLRLSIPYIKEGGHIKLVIPSALLFGCTGYPGVVPPNAPLYYDLVLTDVR